MANGIRRKKRGKKVVVFFSLLLVAASVGGVIWSRNKKEKIVTVQTEKVQRRDITQVVTASGKIQPETMVKINAEVSGEIISLPVKEGQSVKQGDLLVRIKPNQYMAQVDRAEAALSSAKASVALQAANQEKAELDFKRMEELYKKRLNSEQEFTASRIALQMARAQYESAQAGVAQADASLKEAKESLAKTSIYSPMDGVVSQVKSELGERVSGSSFTQGTEIMTVADLSMMEARVDIGENDIVLISIGDAVRIEVDAYPERKFKGTVREIANTAKTRGSGTQDEVTHFEVKIRILEKEAGFRPGMSMTADIETETRERVIAVPIQSVTTRVVKKKEGEKAPPSEEKTAQKESDRPQEVVFLMESGKAKMVPVKRGISDEAYVEIVSGVPENGEVVSGSYKAINRELEDGILVTRQDDHLKPEK